MKFKSKEVEANYKSPHRMLVQVLKYIEWYCDSHFGTELLITESRRPHERTIELYMGSMNPKTGKPYRESEVPFSTHSTDPLRAVDKRGERHHANNQKLDKAVNDMYVYDPDRPQMKVCRFHKVGGGAWHVHIQVHDKTRLREV